MEIKQPKSKPLEREVKRYKCPIKSCGRLMTSMGNFHMHMSRYHANHPQNKENKEGPIIIQALIRDKEMGA